MTSHPRSMPLDLLEVALQTSAGIVEQIDASDLHRPTPCDELDVQQLLEHLIGWQLVFGACAVDQEPALDDGSPTYRASHDLLGDLQAASAQLLANLERRTDETITLPYRGDRKSVV